MTHGGLRTIKKVGIASCAAVLIAIAGVSVAQEKAVYLFYLRKDLSHVLKKDSKKVVGKKVVVTDELLVIWPEVQKRKSTLNGDEYVVFDTTYFQAPGRMNICDDHPFKVILDYGHNPAAVEAMVKLVGLLEVEGKRTVVMAGPGDRRDADLQEIARLCAKNFDSYICRRDDQLRGRASDEVPLIQRHVLLDEGVEAERIQLIPEEAMALDAALVGAQPGDLLLVFGDNIDRCWKQITEFNSSDAQDGTKSASEATSPAPELPSMPDMSLDLGELIRDERGVRLARSVDLED